MHLSGSQNLLFAGCAHCYMEMFRGARGTLASNVDPWRTMENPSWGFQGASL